MILGYFAKLFRRWQVYHQTYAELMRLDDRTLADISVNRSQIDSIARHAAKSVR
jgi:uncharacterized protein YjiS (DUF1127 family)